MRRVIGTILSLAIVALGLTLGARIASAQTITTGSISGEIKDAQGGTLPGATVTATHVPTGTSFTAVTDNDGRFQVQGVRVGGPYTVTVTMPGFKPYEGKDLTVQLGDTLTIKTTLELATRTETVTVTGEATPVDITRAGTASNLSDDVIKALPTINRSIFDFAKTNAYFNVGATYSATDDTAVSVAGRNNRYNNMQIDGAVSNDVFGLSSTGTPGGQTGTQPISLDALQEIQLVVSSYDIRQGGFTGGSINAVTRGGSNNVTGTAYYFGRSQSLIGTIPRLATAASASTDDTKVGTFSDKQGGFSIGGPIKKSKAFFFGNMEWTRKRTPSGYAADRSSGQPWGTQSDVQTVVDIAKNIYGYDPGPLSEYSPPNSSNKVFGRLDVNLKQGHQLVIRTNYVDGISHVGTVSSTSYLLPDRFYQIQDKNLSNVGQLNSTFGSAFNELRVYYQRERNVRGHRPEFARFPAIQIDLTAPTSVNFGTEFSSQANRLDQDVFEITDDFTWVKGKHTITAGTHNEFFQFYNLFIQGAYGSYRFASPALFQAGQAQSYTTNFSNTSNLQEAAEFSVKQFGMYVGDMWRPRANLTITYGLRADMTRFPKTPLANPLSVTNFNYRTDVVPSPTMISPRVGFNYALNSSSSKPSQIRGGVGIFAGRTPYVWLSNQYGNTGVQFTNLAVNFNAANRLPFSANPDSQPKTVAGGLTGRQTINLIDPDYVYPQVIRGNLAVDRDLGFLGLIGTGEVVFSRNLKDIYYKNINYIPDTAVSRPDGRFVYRKFDTSLNDVMLLTNTDQGSSWMVTFKVDKPFRNGFYATGSVGYGDSKSITDGTSSVARSNWLTTPVGVDTNNPALTRSNYSPGGKVTVSLTIPVRLGGGLSSYASFSFNGQSGKPYTLRFNGDVNLDGATTNDIMFIPASSDQVNVSNGTWEQLDAFLSADPAASMSRGKIMERNIARSPWINQLDVKYSVTLPTGGKTKVELTMDILNLGNLLNPNWGWQYYPKFPSVNDLLGVTVVGGKYTYNLTPLTLATSSRVLNYGGVFDRSDLRSRWQAQFGARVKF